MQKRSNNIYTYIYIISASLSMATADAEENNITGLQIGFGLNVSRDNYESDVNIGVLANYEYSNIKEFGEIEFQAAESISNDKFTKENATQFINDLVNTKQAIHYDEEYEEEYETEYPEKDIKFGDATIIHSYQEEFEQLGSVYVYDADSEKYTELNNAYVKKQDNWENEGDSILRYDEEQNQYFDVSCLDLKNEEEDDDTLTIYRDNGETDNIWLQSNQVTDGYTSHENMKFFSLEQKGSYFSKAQGAPGFFSRHTKFSRSSTNIGGELKLAYFRDIGDEIIAGLDFSGNVLPKNCKKVEILPFKYNENIAIYNENNEKICSAVYDEATNKYNVDQILGNASIAKEENLSVSVDTTRITNSMSDIKKTYLQLIAPSALSLTRDNIYVSEQDPAEMSFEKGAFNPKLAFVAGKSFGDWFIGARAGMEYVSGKVHLKTSNQHQHSIPQNNSKNVSIASPFVGLHVIKQTKLCGGANMYVTADWNIGDGHKKVDMNGVKSFKYSGYNVSAGVTWKCKIGL